MARGPKPEPAAVKRAKGNPGRRPIADDNPSKDDQFHPDELGAVPAWLSTRSQRTARAKQITDLAETIWRALYADLVRMRLLKTTDENAFGRYCRYMAEWVFYTRTLDKEGMWYATNSDFAGELKRPHPAMRFRKDAEQALKDLGESMGLTPAARQRILAQLSASNQLTPPGNTRPPDAAAPASGEGAGQQGELGLGEASPVGFLSRLN